MITQKLPLYQQYYISMSFLEQASSDISEPLLKPKHPKPEKSFPKLLNKRKSITYSHPQSPSPSKLVSLPHHNQIIEQTQDVSEQLINSAQDIFQHTNLLNNRKQLNASQKKSIKVQFNKKHKQNKQISKKPTLQLSKQRLKNKLSINQSIYQKFELQGLRIKSNWQVPAKSKAKSFNSQIMNLEPRIQYFLYYMNLILNTIFRLGLLAILALMIIYHRDYKAMQIIVSLQVVAAFLYCLAMIKMLYTKKDQESIYMQKHFTERDITDIEMDRVLRKHFTWRNIMKNVSAYFKLNSKFKKDIKITILRQQIFKRMQIVLCFIPFTLIFFTTPNVFKFQCEYPVQHIVPATICLEFVRMTVHYIVIFIEN